MAEENGTAPESGRGKRALRYVIIGLVLIGVAILVGPHCKGWIDKQVDGIFDQEKVEGTGSDLNKGKRKKKGDGKAVVQISEQDDPIAAACFRGTQGFYESDKGQETLLESFKKVLQRLSGGSKPANSGGAACTPAKSTNDSQALKKAKDQAAAAEKARKEAAVRAFALVAELEEEQAARANDNEQSAKQIKYLRELNVLLANDRATPEQKQEIRNASCDDPRTSSVRLTTNTDGDLFIGQFFLSNNPSGEWIAPFSGQEGVNVIYPRCVDVSKEFLLAVEMNVDDDEDPNFIQQDEDGECSELLGSIHVWADNTGQNMELDESHITTLTVGDEEICAFSVRFNNR